MENGFWKWLWRFNALVIAVGATLIVGVIGWELTRDLRRDLFPTRTTQVINIPDAQAPSDPDTPNRSTQVLRYGSKENTGVKRLYVVPVYSAQTYQNRGISKSSTGNLVDYVVVDAQAGSAERLFGNAPRLILRTDPLVWRDSSGAKRIGTLLSVVENDTNANGQLNQNDDAILYLISRDWRTKTKLVDGVARVHGIETTSQNGFDLITMGADGGEVLSGTVVPPAIQNRFALPPLPQGAPN